MHNIFDKPADIREVRVSAGAVALDGDLRVPAGASRVVLFAHGSASIRHSPRNRYVAGVLNYAGMATLLLDLLTPAEVAIDLRTAHLRFDIWFNATEGVARDPQGATSGEVM
jgi:hypothetical protein